MSRRPGFGASIAEEVAEEMSKRASAPAGPPSSPTALQAREKALRSFSDDIKYDQNHWVDPAVCRPSAENARVYGDLTFENCAELIDAIKSEGEQRFPAMVRTIEEEGFQYEIVAGLRRHFAISWLRANNYPNYRYLVAVRDLDDEAAFRLSDLENRARADITDLERGESYRSALAKHYRGNIEEMANRLNVSSRNLRRYIELASLHPSIVDALGGRRIARVAHATEIATEMRKDRRTAEGVLAQADLIAREQHERAAAGESALPTSDVLRRLKSPATKNTSRTPPSVDVASEGGGALFSYVPPHRKLGLAVRFPARPAVSADEMKAAVGKLIDDFYSAKRN